MNTTNRSVRKLLLTRKSNLPIYAFFFIEGLFLTAATSLFCWHKPCFSLAFLLVFALLGTVLSFRACVQALRTQPNPIQPTNHP